MSRAISYVRFPGDVRVTEKPDKRGYHRCRWTGPDGTPGDRRFPSWAAAEAFAYELSNAIRSDHTGAPKLGDRPISELVEAWYEPDAHDRPLSPTYIKSARSGHNRYIRPTIGTVRCGAWTPDHSRKVLAAGQEAGLAPATIERLRRDLFSLIAVGKALGYLGPAQSPMAGIRSQSRQLKPDLDQLPEKADVARLARAAAEHTGQWWRGLQVRLLAESGMRVSEMLGLTHDDVEVSRSRLRVGRQLLALSGDAKMGLPKYDSRRTIGLMTATLDQLRQLVAEHADADPVVWEGHGKLKAGSGIPLFPGFDGGFERYQTFKNQRWNPACLAAGWPRDPAGRGFVWTPHTLRHFFCTVALAPKAEGGWGLEVADVSRRAGHKNPSFTFDTYVGSRPGGDERLTAALDGWGWDDDTGEGHPALEAT